MIYVGKNAKLQHQFNYRHAFIEPVHREDMQIYLANIMGFAKLFCTALLYALKPACLFCSMYLRTAFHEGLASNNILKCMPIQKQLRHNSKESVYQDAAASLSTVAFTCLLDK